MALPAYAVIESEVSHDYYEIEGKTGRQLKHQMRELGPKGFWAYTRWHVKWSSDCIVSLTVSYTYPRLKDRAQVPLSLRMQWDKMMKTLEEHEIGHAEHGFTAAHEIKDAECKGAKKIVQKWAQEDKKYDKQTKHGKTQGLFLAD